MWAYSCGGYAPHFDHCPISHEERQLCIIDSISRGRLIALLTTIGPVLSSLMACVAGIWGRWEWITVQKSGSPNAHHQTHSIRWWFLQVQREKISSIMNIKETNLFSGILTLRSLWKKNQGYFFKYSIHLNVCTILKMNYLIWIMERGEKAFITFCLSVWSPWLTCKLMGKESNAHLFFPSQH